ncbi:unnamed protein product, partial [Ranitomeya imitator]
MGSNVAPPYANAYMARYEDTLIYTHLLGHTVNKDTNGNLSTDLYSKPTDRNSLLHYDSFHPPNMKKSIPKSQLNREE